jgi:glycosyltransferase involved in cell wall biosynthesis
MKPVFVVGGLYSQANGVARIMRGLAAALGRAGSPVTVYGAECFGRQSIGHIFEQPNRWMGARGVWLGGLSWAPRLKRMLRSGIEGADVVHNHSVWMLPNSYSSRIAGSVRKPVVITAHGTLESWALRHSRWKKRAVGLLFQNRDLRAADCLHVNSRQEIEGIRAFGLKCPVAVIPNGIHPPDLEPLPPASVFHEAFPATRDKKIALFMGRLHVKKGLDHLLRAWARLAGQFPDWQLVLAGPDCGFGGQARRLVDEFNLSRTVTFTGNLEGNLRLAVLSAADIFVHPSFSEGFSMAVLEALSCHLPALITPGCNFEEAVAVGAAVEVLPNTDDTENGLRRLLSLSDAERQAMGRRGRALIEEAYTWDRVAAQTLDLYQWLCGTGPRPATVIEN